MSLTAHLFPALFVLALWFVGTGLVVWLDNRARGSFVFSLSVMGVVAIAAIVVVVLTAESNDPLAVYAAFAASFAIWAWHELSFLTGAATGPRRLPCPPGITGWARFRVSAATVLYHEIALAVTLLVLTIVTWNGTNPVAAQNFGLLFAMRLSTKLNLFLGVPNFSTEILPPQLGWLKGYFRIAPFNALMPLSLVAGIAATFWFANAALSAEGDAAIGWSLLGSLALLGVAEHVFLVLPLRDSALWRWAIPARVDG